MGFGNMNQMKMLQEMQKKMMKAQEELETDRVEGSSGGGMVVVVCDGHGNVKSIKIKPEVVDQDDVEMLEDLVLAAVNEAIEASSALRESKMAAVTGGLNLPGMGGKLPRF
jgi:DNA-binding YbaB/EbfC family protein